VPKHACTKLRVRGHYTLPILNGGSHSICGVKTILQQRRRRGYVWYMWSCLACLGVAVYTGTMAPSWRSTARARRHAQRAELSESTHTQT
jgi:glucose/arabinose dehydrogenase